MSQKEVSQQAVVSKHAVSKHAVSKHAVSQPQGGIRQISEEKIWSGHVLSLNTVTIMAPNGEQAQREVIRHPGAVVVVPIEDGCALLVKQYRSSIDAELLELPAGKRDVLDEPPEVTAARELEEEIGRRSGRISLLAKFYTSPGFTDELSYCYLAQELTRGVSSPQGLEEGFMSIVKVELCNVDEMIKSGELIDAKSIIGLTLARAALGL